MEVIDLLRWALLILWGGFCAVYLLVLLLGVLAYAGKGAERLLLHFNRLPGLRR